MATTDINMTEVRNVYKYFEENNFHVSMLWLDQCVNWLKQEYNTSYNQDFLNKTVYEQWLLADLRDMEIGSLPENIRSFRKHTLRGKYAMQVEYTKDSSQSSYTQLQKIRNNCFNEIDSDDQNKNKSNSNRVLSLYMCDGVQDVIGMEYQPIKSLNKNLMPGIKVMICGPVVCRRGVLFLEEINIKILGGECEELLIKNANENILARSLNLSENNAPYESLKSTDTIKTENDILSAGLDDWMATFNFDQIENLANSKQRSLKNLNVQNILPAISKKEENESHLHLEDDFLEYVDILDENFSDSFDPPEEINPNMVDIHSERLHSSTISMSNSESSSLLLQCIKPKKVSSEPFVYIKQLLEENISSGKFIVKGRIKILTKKLRFVKRWSLECIITDGSGCLEVSFDNSVLENLIGYSAKKMTLLQHQMTNNSYRDQVTQALQKMKNKLMILNALFEIEFNESIANIIDIRGINDSHLKQIQFRLNQRHL